MLLEISKLFCFSCEKDNKGQSTNTKNKTLNLFITKKINS